MKRAQFFHQNQSQTHSELLKTIIFPKNNLNNIKSRLPEPQYTPEVLSEQPAPSIERPSLKLSQSLAAAKSSQLTKDTSNSSSLQPKQRPSLAESIKIKNQLQLSKQNNK